MSAILTFITTHSSLVSMGALILSVFFAGTMLQGERERKEEIRRELREIEALTASTMERVAQVNQYLKQEDQRLLEELDAAYTDLAELNKKAYDSQFKIEQDSIRNANQNNQVSRTRDVIRRNSGFTYKNP